MALGGWGEGGGPWEWKVGFSDLGLGAKEREVDRSRGTNGTSGLALQTPLCPLCRPLAQSSEVLPELRISSLDWLFRPRDLGFCLTGQACLAARAFVAAPLSIGWP